MTVQRSTSSQSKNSTSSAPPDRPRTWSALFDDKPVRIVFAFMCHWSMQANRNIHLCRKKSTQLQIPQQSTQTQQTCGYRHMTKTSGVF